MEFLLSLLHNQSLEQENRKLNLSQVGRKRKNKEQDIKTVWSHQRAKHKCQTGTQTEKGIQSSKKSTNYSRRAQSL